MESFESSSRPAPRRRLTPAELELERRKDSLQLSRTRVLHDIEDTRNPRHRKLLEETLAYLDAKLGELG